MNSSTVSRTPVFYCPACGNRAPHRVCGEHWTDVGGEFLPNEVFRILILGECQTCSRVALFECVGDDIEDGQAVWPKFRLPTSVPATVAEIYESAQEHWERDLNAFALHIRRGLEAICDDQQCGTSRDVLGRRLRSLQGRLPEVLRDAPKLLKDLCNEGAHFGGSLTTSDRRVIDTFFLAVLDYVYIAPARLEDYKRAVGTAKSSNASGSTT